MKYTIKYELKDYEYCDEYDSTEFKAFGKEAYKNEEKTV
jgi:hypothetical protein